MGARVFVFRLLMPVYRTAYLTLASGWFKPQTLLMKDIWYLRLRIAASRKPQVFLCIFPVDTWTGSGVEIRQSLIPETPLRLSGVIRHYDNLYSIPKRRYRKNLVLHLSRGRPCQTR